MAKSAVQRPDKLLTGVFLLSAGILTGQLSLAATLEPGKIELSEEASFAASSSIWQGSTLVPFGGDGSAEVFGLATRARFGLKDGFEIDAGFVFSTSKMASGFYLNRVAGQTETEISEVSFGLRKQLVRTSAYDLVAVGEVRAPGDTAKSPDDFIALSDDSTKYGVGIKQSVAFSPVFSVFHDFTYSYRPGGLPDQFLTDLGLSVSAGRFAFNPFGTYFGSLSGIDVGSPEFEPSSAPPFPFVKESYAGAGLSVVDAVNAGLSLNVYGFDKLTGINTVKSVSFGAGASFLF